SWGDREAPRPTLGAQARHRAAAHGAGGVGGPGGGKDPARAGRGDGRRRGASLCATRVDDGGRAPGLRPLSGRTPVRHGLLLAGRYSVWWRRVLLAVVGLLLIAALVDVFGQRPHGSRVATPAATLSVYAPTAIRGGLLWEARFHITAHQDIEEATLVLDSGWA